MKTFDERLTDAMGAGGKRQKGTRRISQLWEFAIREKMVLRPLENARNLLMQGGYRAAVHTADSEALTLRCEGHEITFGIDLPLRKVVCSSASFPELNLAYDPDRFNHFKTQARLVLFANKVAELREEDEDDGADIED